MNWPPLRDSEADVSSVGPVSERFKELYRKIKLRYWLVPGNVKNNRINQLNEKRSLIP